jgi:hypothetical protein
MFVVDKEELKKKIDIVFDVEERNRWKKIRFHYEEVVNIGSVSAFTEEKRPLRKDFQLKSEDNFILNWDTFATLKQLYISVQRIQGCRNTFISIIENKLSELHLNSTLAFYFLMKIGCNDIIIRALKLEITKSLTTNSYLNENTNEISEFEEYKYGKEVNILCQEISLFMHLEPTYFDDYFLSQLEEIIDYPYEHICIDKRSFEDETLLRAYNKLVNELKGSNEELNIHKENVIEMITKYGFPSDMEICLLEIDKLPDHLSNWQTINSGMIGNLRSFFEVLVKSTAAKIKAKTGKEYPKPKDPNQGEMGIKRAYIKEQLGLSEKDNKLIDSFVGILIKEGGHAFTSDKKHFMLTKNIGIELAYFLLSVYEEKFETLA